MTSGNIINPYLKSLEKIEFVLTYACTGKCKHCAEGDHELVGERIDPKLAREAVRKIASLYNIRTVMTFGGEPLLHTDAVYAIIGAAAELDIPVRQVITNGFFSTDGQRIAEVARELARVGVNDLLISTDAFHQETIPLGVVKDFAREAVACGIPARLSPAWVVSPEADNPYNRKTKEVLDAFSDLDIPIGEGNIVYPSGNAKRYLAEYFTDEPPKNPYEEDPRDVHCVSFSPNGDVLGGNIYREESR